MTNNYIEAKEFLARFEFLTLVIVACFVICVLGFLWIMFGNWDEEDE